MSRSKASTLYSETLSERLYQITVFYICIRSLKRDYRVYRQFKENLEVLQYSLTALLDLVDLPRASERTLALGTLGTLS